MCFSVSVYVMPSFRDIPRLALVFQQLMLVFIWVPSWLVNVYKQREAEC